MAPTQCSKNPECPRPDGHRGRCKLSGSKAAAGRSGRKLGGAGGPVRAIGRRAERIEAEIAGLIADCQTALSAQDAALRAMDERNAALLKSLVASRRQVQRMTRGLAAKAGESE